MERRLYKHPIKCKTLKRSFRGVYEAARTLIEEGLANYSTPRNYIASINKCLDSGTKDRMGYEWEYIVLPDLPELESLPYEAKVYGKAIRCEELGLTWPSQQAASEWLGLSKDGLAQAFKHSKDKRRCKYKGYTWVRITSQEVKELPDLKDTEIKLRSQKCRGKGKLVCRELNLEFDTVADAAAYFNTYVTTFHRAFRESEVKDKCWWNGYEWEWIRGGS